MKRFLILTSLCVILSGCNPAPADVLQATAAPQEVTVPTERAEVPTTIPIGTASPVKLSYVLYLPDENAEYFVPVPVETDRIDADTVLAALQEHNALPDTVLINAFGSDGNKLIIDFNQAFGDLVSSTGTSGERMIVGSVVNTFLSAFQAESVYFTVEGEILESGHVIYDFPITFME